MRPPRVRRPRDARDTNAPRLQLEYSERHHSARPAQVSRAIAARRPAISLCLHTQAAGGSQGSAAARTEALPLAELQTALDEERRLVLRSHRVRTALRPHRERAVLTRCLPAQAAKLQLREKDAVIARLQSSTRTLPSGLREQLADEPDAASVQARGWGGSSSSSERAGDVAAAVAATAVVTAAAAARLGASEAESQR